MGVVDYLGPAVKGMAMGAANVIPGVSGGTIAFITGIYERLILAIKSFDLTAGRLVLAGRFREFAAHVHFGFLSAVFFGVAVSILSLAKLLEYLFVRHEMLTMAFFFGLIVASVYSVGRRIGRWTAPSVSMLVIGVAVAVGLAFLKPAAENPSPWYVFLCGIVAISSMILPGLSGSYVLLIMGNYLLVLRAVSGFEFSILVPLALGCGVGLVGFSHAFAYVYKRYRDPTIGLLTGFVAGSLAIIWPWKEALLLKGPDGTLVTKSDGEAIVTGYQWYWPAMDASVLVALALMLVAAGIVVGLERLDRRGEAGGAG